VTSTQLLAEVEDVIRTMPQAFQFLNPQYAGTTLPWVGRARAVIRRWNIAYAIPFAAAIEQIQVTHSSSRGFRNVAGMLYDARADLRMEVGQLSVVTKTGDVFEYFDEVRRIIEGARVEVFFVDAYLNAEFVARFLPHVERGVGVRLLGRKGMQTLVPAVELFAQQSGIAIEVRSSSEVHERYLFVDRKRCILSGASFKDGAKTAPAVVSEIVDAFRAMWDTYDGLWNSGKVVIACVPPLYPDLDRPTEPA
jgi:hypothetical protein